MTTGRTLSRLVICLSLLVLASIPRYRQINAGLPLYSIDENDVVETAVAVVNDWPEYYIHHYGPAFMNVLAGVYIAWGTLFHEHVDHFNAKIFFDPSMHFLLGRLLLAIVLSFCAFLAWRNGSRLHSREAGFYAALLMSLPLMESLTKYTLRLDAALAVVQFAALMVALEAGALKSRKLTAGAAFLTALAFATKGLQALPLVPFTMLALVWEGFRVRKGFLRQAALTAKRSVTSPLPYLFLITVMVAYPVLNPVMFNSPSEFLTHQIWILRVYEDFGFERGWYEVFVKQLGWSALVFCPLLGAAVYQLLRGGRELQFLSLSALTFITVMSFRPVPDRTFCSVVPIFCLIGGVSLAQLTEYIRQTSWRKITLATCTAACMVVYGFSPVGWSAVRAPVRKYEHTNAFALTEWIRSHVPEHARVFFHSLYPEGPRLLASNPEAHKKLGEFFMYGRDRSEYLHQLFAYAYSLERRDTVSHDIASVRYFSHQLPENLPGETQRLLEAAEFSIFPVQNLEEVRKHPVFSKYPVRAYFNTKAHQKYVVFASSDAGEKSRTISRRQE